MITSTLVRNLLNVLGKCSTYKKPATPEFLHNVRHEVYYQVRRLNRHPAMCVWTGGNELEGYNLDMLSYNDTWGQSFFNNFTKVQMGTIWPELYRNTRSLSWIQSSDSHGYSYYNPETGALLNRYGDVATEYPSPYYGPAELYNLDTAQAFNHSKLPAARFMVEFGIWSYDSLESYQTILPDSHINPEDPIIIQRCYDDGPDTVKVLADAVRTYYVFPNHTNHLTQFDQLTWTTQIYHAEQIKSQIESYSKYCPEKCKATGLRLAQEGQSAFRRITWASYSGSSMLRGRHSV